MRPPKRGERTQVTIRRDHCEQSGRDTARTAAGKPARASRGRRECSQAKGGHSAFGRTFVGGDVATSLGAGEGDTSGEEGH